MTRAALYARYSSDNHSEASIDNQFRLCRERAGQERWEIVGSYEDAAISGSSTILRSGIQMKTHRGPRGRVEKGKAGGGLCYGYKIVKKFDASGEPLPGDREIIPEEAEMNRRIFREDASGKSPKSIAVDLNREAIPGPMGRGWGDTSIRGHRTRGTCDNNRTITRDKIGARVLSGLNEKLVSSEAVAEAIRAYAEEMNRLNRDRRTQAETAARRWRRSPRLLPEL